MPQPDESPDAMPKDSPNRQLWRDCQNMDAAEDEAARLLDLAAYADGTLDEDERDRVAQLLAADAEAAADVAAARALAGADTGSADERIVARAAALVPETAAQAGIMLPFRRAARRPNLQWAAGWASLAAGLAVASWLGFAMGADASLAFHSPDQAISQEGPLPDLLDPTSGFLGNLADGRQT